MDSENTTVPSEFRKYSALLTKIIQSNVASIIDPAVCIQMSDIATQTSHNSVEHGEILFVFPNGKETSVG